MKMMHELIDLEDPRCLYCGSQCDISYSASVLTSYTVDHDSLRCRSCKEVFEINFIQSLEGETTYTSFDFTCRGYIIKNYYLDNVFSIENISDLKTPIFIPVFEIDFSNKNKLFQKLKTYILFS